MQNFNQSLHRNIKEGHSFTPYISLPTGKQVNMGVGDTLHSTRAMKRLIELHFSQVQKLAKILKGKDLKETCNNIHDFIFWHLQYKQDNALQQLRTPANSWKNRKEGIDCKSYSIFAGCLLRCLGIKFYIRQIKQAFYNPNAYSHVYIIVPFDQVRGSLEQSYYCIDGTLKTNKEPIFTQKHDLIMNLQHVGLNGAKKTTRKPKTKTTTKRTTRKPTKRTTAKKTGLFGVIGGLAAGVGLGMLIK